MRLRVNPPSAYRFSLANHHLLNSLSSKTFSGPTSAHAVSTFSPLGKMTEEHDAYTSLVRLTKQHETRALRCAYREHLRREGAQSALLELPSAVVGYPRTAIGYRLTALFDPTVNAIIYRSSTVGCPAPLPPM